MGDKSRDEKQDCARRIANLFRRRGSEDELSEILGTVARTLGVSPTPEPLPDLSDPGVYLDFFPKTLDFAIFPRKSRRPLAACSGINDKASAWEWLYD